MVPGNWNSTAESDILSLKRMRFTDDEAQIFAERRQINSRISNERLLEILENNFLTLKDDSGRIHISAVLSDFLKKMSDIRKIFDGNIHWHSGYEIPFPVVTEENRIPHYTFYKIKLVADQLTTQTMFVHLQP